MPEWVTQFAAEQRRGRPAGPHERRKGMEGQESLATWGGGLQATDELSVGQHAGSVNGNTC